MAGKCTKRCGRRGVACSSQMTIYLDPFGNALNQQEFSSLSQHNGTMSPPTPPPHQEMLSGMGKAWQQACMPNMSGIRPREGGREEGGRKGAGGGGGALWVGVNMGKAWYIYRSLHHTTTNKIKCVSNAKCPKCPLLPTPGEGGSEARRAARARAKGRRRGEVK